MGSQGVFGSPAAGLAPALVPALGDTPVLGRSMHQLQPSSPVMGGDIHLTVPQSQLGFIRVTDQRTGHSGLQADGGRGLRPWPRLSISL